MPKKYLAESICDRIAASKNYNRGNYQRQMALDYFLREKEHTFMHENTKRDMEYLLRYYVENGEKKTFKYIKMNYRK